MKESKKEITETPIIKFSPDIPLLEQLNNNNWQEIISHLEYNDLVMLLRFNKSVSKRLNQLLNNSEAILPIIRNKLQNYLQRKIPFQNFSEGENKYTNYKEIYYALSILVTDKKELYNQALLRLFKQNIPEAQLISLILYLKRYPKVNKELLPLITNFLQLAEKFYNHSPSPLTALILCNFLMFFGNEYIKAPFLITEHKEYKPSLYSDAIKLLSQDQALSYKDGQARFSYPYCELMKQLMIKAFESFGLDKQFSQLTDQEQWPYVTIFSKLSAYYLLLSLQKYGLQKQAFELNRIQYDNFNLRDNTWIFDIYKEETINKLKSLHNVNIFTQIIRDASVYSFMKNTTISYDLKYMFFTTLVNLIEDNAKRVATKEFISTILNAFNKLLQNYPASQAVNLLFVYYEFPNLIKYLKNKNLNNLFLTISTAALMPFAHYLENKTQIHESRLISRLIELFQLAQNSNDMPGLIKILHTSPYVINEKQIQEIFDQFKQKIASDYTYINLDRTLHLPNKALSGEKSNVNTYFFVNRVKIKNLKRKVKDTEEKLEPPAKRMHHSGSSADA